MKKRTTIALSKQTYDELHILQCKLEGIVKSKLSPEKVVQILLSVRPLENQLMEMILETEAVYPSKSKKKEESEWLKV